MIKRKTIPSKLCKDLLDYLPEIILEQKRVMREELGPRFEKGETDREKIFIELKRIDLEIAKVDARDAAQWSSGQNAFAQFNQSISNIDKNLNSHIAEENSEFKSIHNKLDSLHHTLNNIKVNGGVYPLPDAIQHLYNVHSEIRNEVKELKIITVDIAIRKKWFQSTREMINKSIILHFLTATKPGWIVTGIILVILVNTISHIVFGVELDAISIIKEILFFFSKTSQ